MPVPQRCRRSRTDKEQHPHTVETHRQRLRDVGWQKGRTEFSAAKKPRIRRHNRHIPRPGGTKELRTHKNMFVFNARHNVEEPPQHGSLLDDEDLTRQSDQASDQKKTTKDLRTMNGTAKMIIMNSGGWRGGRRRGRPGSRCRQGSKGHA